MTIVFDPQYKNCTGLVSETGSCSSTNYDCYAPVAYAEVSVVDDTLQIQDMTWTDAGDDNASVYKHFALKNEAGELIGTASMSSGSIRFSNVDYDMKEGTETLTVYAQIASITSIVNTGAKISLVISAATDVKVVSKSTSQAITATVTGVDATTDANQINFRAYKSIPSVSMVKLSDSTLVEASGKEVFKFSVTADDASDLYLSRVSIDVDAESSVDLQNPHLYELNSTNSGDELKMLYLLQLHLMKILLILIQQMTSLMEK